MVVIISDDKLQVTITLTVDEAAILDRALTEHGPDVVLDLVSGWLNERDRVQVDADLADVRGGRASPSVKARVRARLGL
jgi:hypothetical protein